MKVMKHLIKERSNIFNLRISESEMKEIKKRAKDLYNGNVSGYMKHAALNYRPKKEDLVEVSVKK